MEKCARCAPKRREAGPRSSPRGINRAEIELQPANRRSSERQHRDDAQDGVLCRPSLSPLLRRSQLSRLLARRRRRRRPRCGLRRLQRPRLPQRRAEHSSTPLSAPEDWCALSDATHVPRLGSGPAPSNSSLARVDRVSLGMRVATSHVRCQVQTLVNDRFWAAAQDRIRACRTVVHLSNRKHALKVRIRRSTRR